MIFHPDFFVELARVEGGEVVEVTIRGKLTGPQLVAGDWRQVRTNLREIDTDRFLVRPEYVATVHPDHVYVHFETVEMSAEAQERLARRKKK